MKHIMVREGLIPPAIDNVQVWRIIQRLGMMIDDEYCGKNNDDGFTRAPLPIWLGKALGDEGVFPADIDYEQACAVIGKLSSVFDDAYFRAVICKACDDCRVWFEETPGYIHVNPTERTTRIKTVRQKLVPHGSDASSQHSEPSSQSSSPPSPNEIEMIKRKYSPPRSSRQCRGEGIHGKGYRMNGDMTMLLELSFCKDNTSAVMSVNENSTIIEMIVDLTGKLSEL